MDVFVVSLANDPSYVKYFNLFHVTEDQRLPQMGARGAARFEEAPVFSMLRPIESLDSFGM
jgi:hypothetical protein